MFVNWVLQAAAVAKKPLACVLFGVVVRMI